jgi:hypothetical protein
MQLFFFKNYLLMSQGETEVIQEVYFVMPLDVRRL